MRPFEFADEPGTRVVLCKVFPVEADKITEEEALRIWESSAFRPCFLDKEKLGQIIADALEIIEENPPLPTLEMDQETVPDPILTSAVGERIDATCTVEVSEDKMHAELVITAAKGGRHLETTDVTAALTEKNVIRGVEFQWISRLVKEAEHAAPGAEVRGIVAEGKAPAPGIPSQFEFVLVPFEDRILQPQTRPDGTLDMHNLGDIDVAEVGDSLVRRIPAKPGEPGFDVLGNEIPSQAPPDIPFEVGDGTEISPSDPHLLIAKRHGVPLKLKHGMKVDEVLVVTDVDIHTGNLDYDGSVMVRGDVKNGMCVTATSDIYVNGFVENAHVLAQGNVVVKQGIIGKANATKDPQGKDAEDACYVKGKNIMASFSQHAFLEAEEKVELGAQLLHCHVLRCTELHVGDEIKRKAKMVGGFANIAREAHIGILGSIAGTSTLLQFDVEAQPIQLQVAELQKNLESKLETINGLMEAILTLKKMKPSQELMEKMRKAKNTVEQLREEADALIQKIEETQKKLEPIKKQIRLHIFGAAYPGVELKFLDVDYRFKEERKQCQFGISQDRWCNV